MTKKIFRFTLLIVAAVLLTSLAIVIGSLHRYFATEQESQLKDELRLAAYAVEQNGLDYLEKLSAPDYRYAWTPDYRLTWVASDGTVLFDTAEAAGQMENHADRAEIQEAFAKGESSRVRYSTTLTERTLYYAKALGDKTVLRISIRQVTTLTLVAFMLQPLLLVGILSVILSAVLAHWMAGKVVRPLTSLDFEHPLENETYEELAPLLNRLHQQRRQIAAQLHTLQKKTDEFTQITAHMKEGLILLDNNGDILSINPAARQIFDIENPTAGLAPRPAVAGTDSNQAIRIAAGPDLNQAIHTAMEQGHSETRAEKNGREYQLDISRIKSGKTIAGTVLLAFDVTEQAHGERNRREFTANVSHELKTPLQSILGSAELMKNGLVKQEDIPRFLELIHKEAARLVTLVDDIIHLSQLDEGIPLAKESVDLLETAQSAASALHGYAAEKCLRITVKGENARVTGVRSFLYEMLYNLCDNAIKYNVENGSVEIKVTAKGQETAISVKDTGIGISSNDQPRVFERFFRVDKSRSKASGGTGLGLSIVKHIAQYHHAAVELQSTPGEGTTITVRFPAQ